jgi:hypothetical protein
MKVWVVIKAHQTKGNGHTERHGVYSSKDVAEKHVIDATKEPGYSAMPIEEHEVQEN